MKRVFFVLLALVVLTGLSSVAFAVVHKARTPPSQLTIVNQMDEVAAIAVEVCGEAVMNQKLGPRESKTVAFKRGGKCGYKVVIELASGVRREYGGGYVANGFVIDDTLRIARDRIAVESCTSGGTYAEAIPTKQCSMEFQLTPLPNPPPQGGREK